MYEVIVIGAGHAGCEAALASARQKAKTLLLSINMDSIAAMPCNSAVGGPGRGQLVREIDALGGEISKNTDKTFIHMRMLNTSKGPAVRTLRALVDKRRYFLEMKHTLENQTNLDIRQALVVDIKKGEGGYWLKTSDNYKYFSKCVVFCNGTFLRGKIFWGNNSLEAGRQGEIPSNQLPKNLEKIGIKFGRLQTNTPPRIDRKSVDLKFLKKQTYDKNPEMFSYESNYDGREQLNNFITYVKEEGINFIKKNIGKAVSISKNNHAQGPKYCPSIEEKVIRFPHRKRHLLFIQPEGMNTTEMYVHGLMTTFSEKIQYGILKKIKGLEEAVITRPGYGVEYDYILPFQINECLENKNNTGIFFAGQINGTTGYEEAAAQGIVAGINAAKRSRGEKTIKIKREDGYIGILIDDIITKKISEPYRMLTSRNEYRLYHRHDNADFRMVKILKWIGYKQKAELIEKKYERINSAIGQILKNGPLPQLKKEEFVSKYKDILIGNHGCCPRDIDSVYINIKYKDYIKRQIKQIERMENSLDLEIPENIRYEEINNISNEALARLKERKPNSLGQARRLEGVGAADIFALLCYLKNVSRET
ncbi:MAG: tRNA uridine-5-carboxymethylaminomethyl(34) synthesis enzyme MnmG [Actinomycetota bacterium]